ncbi:tachykinin-like peptides receptor 86C [Acanthaster planci]|uniref:Tachykinin-like peptides receptor 86C n=1 Tax=Acanthaster planci TaxID=133434 RepID=A0A8B7ZQL4_ACAPL|nr:tachykinin-like peptides receptor 86C [Acanthaster planci]
MSTPSFRNGHGYLLISLSVADFLVGCVSVLSIYPSATLEGTADAWPYGDTVCLIAAYVGQVALMNSGLALMLLSIERYIAVAHPLKFGHLVTKKTVSIAIAMCWLLVASVFTTIFAGLPPHFYSPQLYICQSVFTENSTFSLVLLVTAVLPCIIIMLVTSAIAKRKLKESARRRAAMVPAIAQSSTASQESALANGTSQTSLKLDRMVRLMMIAVIIHMCPFVVVFILTVGGKKIPQVISFATYWWLICNSFVNTVIYYKKNAKFRARMHELIARAAPQYCIDFEADLSCAWRSSKRKSEPLSPYENPGRPNLELTGVRTDSGNCVENDGFRDTNSTQTRTE